MEPAQSDFRLPLREILQVIRRRLLPIAIVLIAVVGMSLVLTFLQVPMYEASVKMVVGQEQEPGRPSSVSSDVAGLEQFARTAAEVAETLPVAEEVVRELNLDMTASQLLGSMSVEPVATTQVIQINYVDPDPQRAKQIADTIGEVFSRQISEVSPNANAITATLWERAQVPQAPISPNPLRNAFLALILGVVLAAGLTFLLEHFDDSWRSAEEVESISGLPALAVVPEFQVPKGEKKGRRR